MEAEFGAPQWLFGISPYAFRGGRRLCSWGSRDGLWEMRPLALGGADPR